MKTALSGHYKVEPTEKKGTGELPQLTYKIGELTVTFGPDSRGGFLMRAENDILAELAKQEPAARKNRRGVGR